jgi:hypothetical protein
MAVSNLGMAITPTSWTAPTDPHQKAWISPNETTYLTPQQQFQKLMQQVQDFKANGAGVVQDFGANVNTMNNGFGAYNPEENGFTSAGDGPSNLAADGASGAVTDLATMQKMYADMIAKVNGFYNGQAKSDATQTANNQAYQRQMGNGQIGGIMNSDYSQPGFNQVNGHATPYFDPNAPTAQWLAQLYPGQFSQVYQGSGQSGYQPTQGYNGQQSDLGGPFAKHNPWGLS